MSPWASNGIHLFGKCSGLPGDVEAGEVVESPGWSCRLTSSPALSHVAGQKDRVGADGVRYGRPESEASVEAGRGGVPAGEVGGWSCSYSCSGSQANTVSGCLCQLLVCCKAGMST